MFSGDAHNRFNDHSSSFREEGLKEGPQFEGGRRGAQVAGGISSIHNSPGVAFLQIYVETNTFTITIENTNTNVNKFQLKWQVAAVAFITAFIQIHTNIC